MDSTKLLKFQDVLDVDTPDAIGFVVDWTIPDFSFFKACTVLLRSRPCVIGKSTWSLELHPLRENTLVVNGQYLDAAFYYLRHSQPNGFIQNIQAEAKIGIVGAQGDFVRTITLQFNFTNGFVGTNEAGTAASVSHNDLWTLTTGLLVNGALKLRAEVTYKSAVPTQSEEKLLPEVSRNTFQKGFEILCNTQTGRDFVLVSSDLVDKPVHRAVLMARSPVFLAMFESKMTECNTGRCVIPDITGPTLDILVKYMYCGCSEEDIKANTKEVLRAANKYELLELFAQCEKFLVSQLSEENVADFLLMTDKVNVPVLKKAALSYFKTHLDALKTSGAFKAFCGETSVELVTEVVTFLV